jgi:hypothetical protein
MILYAPSIWSQRGANAAWLPRPGLYAALDPVDLGLHPYVLFCVFAGLTTITFLRRYCGRGRGTSFFGGQPPVEEGLHVIVLGFVFLAAPYALLILSWAGSPLLLSRYALPSLIGMALLFGGVSARLFGELADESEATAGGRIQLLGRLITAAMLAALLAFPFWRAVSSARKAITEDKVARYRADASGPIVAASDPASYFPRYFYSGESHNIYYVVRNQEYQERLMRFNPRLNPITGTAFLAAHDHFRLVSDDPGLEWFESELRNRGDFAITTEERTEKRKVLTVSWK